jgi:hypothetical protein
MTLIFSVSTTAGLPTGASGQAARSCRLGVAGETQLFVEEVKLGAARYILSYVANRASTRGLLVGKDQQLSFPPAVGARIADRNRCDVRPPI